MGLYREYISKLESEWVGKVVAYEGVKYNVVGVDYNGILLIDKETMHTDTTAVPISDITVCEV